MARILVIVAFAVLLFIPTLTFADKVVRDQYGNLVETWHDSNGKTDWNRFVLEAGREISRT